MANQQAAASDVSERRDAVPSGKDEAKSAEFHDIMASGMQFLAGLYKMSTGKDMGIDNQQIKVNKETCEVTMAFKLPV